MEKSLFKKIILAFLGCVVLGAGIGMSTKVGIGVDALTSVYTGIVKHTGLSLGTVTALMNVLMCIIAYILYKKNVGIASVLFIFVSKWPVDLANKYMITTDNLFINILLYILSVFVLALGSELFIMSNLGASSYDALTMGVGKRLHHEVKYVYVRYICDATCLLIAFLIGGEIGLGTIICLALIGIFMKTWQRILENVFHLSNDSVSTGTDKN